MVFKPIAFVCLGMTLLAGISVIPSAWALADGQRPDQAATELKPASSFDGLYKGTTQRISGENTEACSAGGTIAIEVAGARFKLPWRPRQAFDAKISAQGGFWATTGNMAAQADKHLLIVPDLRGQVADGRISGSYGTRWCSYRFEAVRQ